MPKPVTLLLVDDTATDRAIYQRFLHQDHRRRYEIVELGTGEAALNWCQQHAPDLILLDYSLPGINGLEFLKRLKQQQAELPPVILLTGYGNTHIAVEAMKQGAQDYLDKNQLKADILCLTVHSVLERVQFHRCLKRQQEQQQLVTEIALRIRQSLDLEDILNTAVQEVRLFLQTDRVIIYRFDSGWQGQVMVEAIGAGWTPMLGEVIYDPCFELDCVNHYRQGRVSTIDNVLTASLEPCYEDLLTRFQVQSNLVVPILQGEDLWGLLIAQHCVSPRLWQTDEIEMLQQLAVQLSIAIHQAELHQQVQHELQERRQAEVQQQQSQARFRAMFEQSPLGIVHFDPQGQLLAVNRAWAKIWDTTTEHLQNYNVLQELSLEQDGNLSAIQRAFVGEPVFLPTFFHDPAWHNRPGRPRWIELLVYPIQDEAGQVLEVILMIKDVTERKQAEIALQEREATLHLFIQYAPASIAMFNCQMEYVVASQRWVQDFQVDSLEAIIGQSHYDIFPEIPERWRQIHQRCLAGAIEQCNEDLFVRADGHYQWLRWEIRPWYDLGGAIGGIIIVCEDITMRKQFQDALLQSEARLKLAQFASNSAVWDCYFPTNTVIWSPEYYQLYELDPSLEPSYDNWLCSVYPDDRDRLHRHVQQALASQVSEINQEFRVLRSDGLRWFLSIGQIFYNAAGEAIRMLGITIDITSQKQTELALQQLNEELEQRVAERTAELCQVNQQLQESNKELENFAFMASHDLKEPLRTVRNFTSLLHFTLGESIGEPGKDYLQRLDKAAQRMQTLIDDLLNLARITTATAPFVVVDLNQVMQQVIANLDVQIQRTGGQIQVGELPTLQADPVQMCQLLQNLLSNALKFRGETLPVVKIYTLRSPDTAVGGNTKVTQHHHIICLTDNGIGFDPKHRDRIFGAFERLHGRNQYEGTGMGLAICKKIVERHGGTITADSTLGQGSTFTIQLPCFSARV